MLPTTTHWGEEEKEREGLHCCDGLERAGSERGEAGRRGVARLDGYGPPKASGAQACHSNQEVLQVEQGRRCEFFHYCRSLVQSGGFASEKQTVSLRN